MADISHSPHSLKLTRALRAHADFQSITTQQIHSDTGAITLKDIV